MSYTGVKRETVLKQRDSSVGRANQWCGKHDVHDFYRYQHGRRSIEAYLNKEQTRTWPRKRAKPRGQSARIPAAEVTQVGVSPSVKPVCC